MTDENGTSVRADEKGKIVLDPIYGMIELDPVAVKIIDTPYFQRLRYIKQLSVADFVYPGATHTRFAHSIGVYHLACEIIKMIESQGLDKEVLFSPMEKRCIQVAALCHDIGHGPFSHSYESIFQKELNGVKHEKISECLVEKMFKDNKNFDLKDDDIDIGLIQALIQGSYEKYKNDPERKKKKYMFQIVSNKTSGMDVDKWDYFNRDAIACGVSERFQFDRALHVVGVVEADGEYQLSYREQDAFSFYNMYNTRLSLHRKVYRHRVVVAVELMVEDVFKSVCEANTNLEESDNGSKIDIFPARVLTKSEEQEENLLLGPNDGSNTGNKYLMIEDYLKLRDDILLKIQDSKIKQYQPAQKLIERIHTRKLYKLIRDYKVMKDVEETSVKKMRDDLSRKLKDDGFEDEFKIKVEKFDYGMKAEDPVEKMYFYGKEDIKTPKKLERQEVSFVLPNTFQEHYIRVYKTISKNTDFTEEEKSRLQNVLTNFETTYNVKLVMKRNPSYLPQSNQ